MLFPVPIEDGDEVSIGSTIYMSCEAATERCASNAAVAWQLNTNTICYSRVPGNHQFNQGDCGDAGVVSPAFSGRTRLVAPYIISISDVKISESGNYLCSCPLDLNNGNPLWSIQIKVIGELQNLKFTANLQKKL